VIFRDFFSPSVSVTVVGGIIFQSWMQSSEFPLFVLAQKASVVFSVVHSDVVFFGAVDTSHETNVN
jgi:hypothetical protein